MTASPNRARDLILAAVRLPPDKWDAFQTEQCAGDETLSARVRALLAAHRQAGGFLEPVAGLDGTADQQATESPGTMIGPYKLLEQIGEGGFGVVFLAEQAEPVRRKVALKVVKPGMDTKQVVARFEVERQALALMDHPHIAKVFDGGQTPTGRPYFVMELVRGTPVTDFCDEGHLTPRQRLELFVQVCQAVQHAHQKGVIHRDLKPTNILVSTHDGTPVAKVIDFGVAKAVGQVLTDKTLFTGFAQMVGTPLYMSPEQAGMSGLDVDTRTDIYSLGVLLYELLTGTTPFDKARFKEAGYDEIRQIIREEEPARPSSRISTLGPVAETVSVNRQTDPRRLRRLCRGELDWIVMRCLEKDRGRRYETANALAADVQRYLRDEMVEARPPSPGYRVRKFARRYRRGLIAALAFVLLLVTAVAGLSVALVTVNRERRQKETALEAEGKRRKQARAALDAMSSLLIEDWLARQTVVLPEHRQFLEQILHDYEAFAEDTGQDEESRAGVAHAYGRVGVIRRRLGQRSEAAPALETSRALYARLAADSPHNHAYRAKLAAASVSLAAIRSELGRGPEGVALLDESLGIYRELVAGHPGEGEYWRGLSRTLNTRGIRLKNLNCPREAEEAYGEALAIQLRLIDESPGSAPHRDELAQTYLNLALVLSQDNRAEAAEQAGTRAVELYDRLASDNPGDRHYREWLAAARNNLGDIVRVADKLPEAERLLRASLTGRRQLVSDYPGVPEYWRGLGMTLTNLGIVLKDTDRVPEAMILYREALDIHRRLAREHSMVPNHRNEAAGAMSNLARLLLARNEIQAARDLLEEAIPHHKAALATNSDHPSYRRFYRINRWRMAEVLLAQNDHAAAATVTREFLQFGYEPPRDSYMAAGYLAGCAKLAAKDESLPEDRRRELATAYADEAVAALSQAVAKGAKDVAQMKSDPKLEPLAQRADFKKLVTEVEAKRKP